MTTCSFCLLSGIHSIPQYQIAPQLSNDIFSLPTHNLGCIMSLTSFQIFMSLKLYLRLIVWTPNKNSCNWFNSFIWITKSLHRNQPKWKLLIFLCLNINHLNLYCLNDNQIFLVQTRNMLSSITHFFLSHYTYLPLANLHFVLPEALTPCHLHYYNILCFRGSPYILIHANGFLLCPLSPAFGSLQILALWLMVCLLCRNSSLDIKSTRNKCKSLYHDLY